MKDKNVHAARSTTTKTKNNLVILLYATITGNMKIKLFFDRAYGQIENILYEKKSFMVGYTTLSFIIQLRLYLFLKVNCVVPENIHTSPTEGKGNFRGGGGSKTNKFKEMY